MHRWTASDSATLAPHRARAASNEIRGRPGPGPGAGAGSRRHPQSVQARIAAIHPTRAPLRLIAASSCSTGAARGSRRGKERVREPRSLPDQPWVIDAMLAAKVWRSISVAPSGTPGEGHARARAIVSERHGGQEFERPVAVEEGRPRHVGVLVREGMHPDQARRLRHLSVNESGPQSPAVGRSKPRVKRPRPASGRASSPSCGGALRAEPSAELIGFRPCVPHPPALAR